MNIAIDILFLSKGTRSGVEEYTLRLLEEMIRVHPQDTFTLFYNAARKTPLFYEWLDTPYVRIKSFSIPNKLLDFSSRLFKEPKLDVLIGGCDVFFSPHFLLGSVSKRARRIITFHDLSFERFPEFFSRDRRIWHGLM